MKTPDKQWSQHKDKDRNKAERDTMRKHKGEQQHSAQQGGGQQGGWGPDQPNQPNQGGQKDMGRKPPNERDRDYDPDGERVGGPIERP